jgi:hypothetical protein
MDTPSDTGGATTTSTPTDTSATATTSNNDAYWSSTTNDNVPIVVLGDPLRATSDGEIVVSARPVGTGRNNGSFSGGGGGLTNSERLWTQVHQDCQNGVVVEAHPVDVMTNGHDSHRHHNMMSNTAATTGRQQQAAATTAVYAVPIGAAQRPQNQQRIHEGDPDQDAAARNRAHCFICICIGAAAIFLFIMIRQGQQKYHENNSSPSYYYNDWPTPDPATAWIYDWPTMEPIPSQSPWPSPSMPSFPTVPGGSGGFPSVPSAPTVPGSAPPVPNVPSSLQTAVTTTTRPISTMAPIPTPQVIVTVSPTVDNTTTTTTAPGSPSI